MSVYIEWFRKCASSVRLEVFNGVNAMQYRVEHQKMESGLGYKLSKVSSLSADKF
jgi:hypothetical protein